MAEYGIVIGLEIHVQLKTRSKMFCRCSNDGENQPPNTTICPVCVGHPGVLPVPNGEAILMSAKTALALNCRIDEWSKFDRKNYFYPDLPKGYQISQYDQPIGREGFLDITLDSRVRHVRINRLHLEEDAAKLMHAPAQKASLVDYNRSSTPLMEIVTEPDMCSPEEAKLFLQELRRIIRYLDVSYADMEKGHMRCDANVSIVFDDHGTHVSTPVSEIKNLNSFRSVEHGLAYEAQRLYEEWRLGGTTKTRTHKITVGWDDAKGETFLQRGKEEAHDYRYFPEPDIPPLHFSSEFVNSLRNKLPELPLAKRARLQHEYGLSNEDASLLCDEKETAAFFEASSSELKARHGSEQYTTLASLVIHRLIPLLEERALSFESSALSPASLADLAAAFLSGRINSATLNPTLRLLIEHPTTALDQLIETHGLAQVQDTATLERACQEVIKSNPDAVDNVTAGRPNTIMFLVGQVMKAHSGKADPKLVKELLEKLILG